MSARVLTSAQSECGLLSLVCKSLLNRVSIIISTVGQIPCSCLHFCSEASFVWDGLLEELDQIADLLKTRAMAHVVIRLELDIVFVLFKQLHRLLAIFVPNHLKEEKSERCVYTVVRGWNQCSELSKRVDR